MRTGALLERSDDLAGVHHPVRIHRVFQATQHAQALLAEHRRRPGRVIQADAVVMAQRAAVGDEVDVMMFDGAI